MVVFCYDIFSQLIWEISFLSGCRMVDEGPMSKLCFAICLLYCRHRVFSLNYLLCIARLALRLLLFVLRGQGLWTSYICLAGGLPTPLQHKVQRIKLDASAYKASEHSEFTSCPSSLSFYPSVCLITLPGWGSHSPLPNPFPTKVLYIGCCAISLKDTEKRWHHTARLKDFHLHRILCCHRPYPKKPFNYAAIGYWRTYMKTDEPFFCFWKSAQFHPRNPLRHINSYFRVNFKQISVIINSIKTFCIALGPLN